jgi:hypothetical protein
LPWALDSLAIAVIRRTVGILYEQFGSSVTFDRLFAPNDVHGWSPSQGVVNSEMIDRRTHPKENVNPNPTVVKSIGFFSDNEMPSAWSMALGSEGQEFTSVWKKCSELTPNDNLLIDMLLR